MGLRDDVTHYLHETLGIRPTARPWPGTARLPYHLQDDFELHELKAADRAILLALNRRKNAPALSVLRARLEKLKAATDLPVAYVTGALASYERKRLIEHKIPFIVPGNQLYLPDLGIDLREYFRQARKEPTESLSPATQAMMLRALLSKSTQTEWQPAEMARDLGYTVMTVSRVVNELIDADIAKLDQRGRVRWLLMERPPAETWELIRPLLRTPVKRQFWTRSVRALERQHLPLAGESALAHYGQLADPTIPIYAVGAGQLKTPEFKNLTEVSEPVTDGCELQVWSYTPLFAAGSKTRDRKIVDPLSLSLSLEGSTDDRIQLALEELKEHFPW